MKKIKIHGVNDLLKEMSNPHNVAWGERENGVIEGIYEIDDFKLTVYKTKTSSAKAKRERFAYRGTVHFTWPSTGEAVESWLPQVVRDSYAGLIRNNESLIIARLKQHFKNSTTVKLVDSIRVES